MAEGQPLRQDMLPRKRDIIQHNKHLNDSGVEEKVKRYRQTAIEVHDIWESADCPPITIKHIISRIQKLESEYRKPKEIGGARNRKVHQRSTERPTKVPS